MTKFEKYMEDLEAYCQEFGCDKRKALMDILMEFYEAAGFWPDVLEAEIKSMSDDDESWVVLNPGTMKDPVRSVSLREVTGNIVCKIF